MCEDFAIIRPCDAVQVCGHPSVLDRLLARRSSGKLADLTTGAEFGIQGGHYVIRANEPGIVAHTARQLHLGYRDLLVDAQKPKRQSRRGRHDHHTGRRPNYRVTHLAA